MKAAAIFPIGASEGGCPAAIAEILLREDTLEIHLLYGIQAAPESPDPAIVAGQIKAKVTDPRVTWATCEPVEPFDMAETYLQVRSFVDTIARLNYDRVYVGVTGSTNPVVASLFQVAMAYLACEVLPIYVQARGSETVRHFVPSEIRDRVIAEEALSSARCGQIRLASQLAARLPKGGKWGVLSASLAALAQWDDFNYEQAQPTLRHQALKAHEQASDPWLGQITETLSRLAAEAGTIAAIVKKVRDLHGFPALASRPDWADLVLQSGKDLVADSLANATRRLLEGRWTDSVLRSYRAAECATQMRLFAIGVHPSRPMAVPDAYRRYGSPSEEVRELAFKSGLEFLGSAGLVDLGPIEPQVRNLASARNSTYLEHGYVRVSAEQAERCFEWSLEICGHLLGADFRTEQRRYEMRF